MHSIFVVTTCQPVLIFRNVIIVEVNFSSYLLCACLLHSTKLCVIFGSTLYYVMHLSLITIFVCLLSNSLRSPMVGYADLAGEL